jgi:hypothetical protein
MFLTTGYWIAGLIGLGIIGVGLRFLINPASAVRGFGIPDSPSLTTSFSAWAATKGVRDILSGLFIFLLMARAPAPLAGEFLLLASLIPIGDATIVLRAGGRIATALGIHAATAVLVIIGGACLVLG